MDADTLGLLRSSLQELLVSAPSDIVPALDALGWDEVLADDAAAATTALFSEQGELLASTRALDTVVAARLGESAAQVGVVYPHPRTSAHPSSVLVDGRLTVSGVLLGRAGDELLVPYQGGVAVVGSAGLQLGAFGGFEPQNSWQLVSGVVEVIRELALPWAAAAAAGQVALAAELLGVSRRALRLASEHVTVREQFGRPIGSYQSVRHRLAEAHTGILAAEAVLEAALVDDTDWAAAAAKAAAGQAHVEVTRHAMQVCGAMGLSWEHDLPRCAKRGYALDALLGSARGIAREQGAALLAGLDPPRIGSPVG